MQRIDRPLQTAATFVNRLAGGIIVAMMILICADVVLRLFGRPIPGTYELVGFAGALAASFSLARTALDGGHIAVEFLVDRLPTRLQVLLAALGSLGGAVLFVLVTWHSFIYALDLKESGEVSMTLGFPVYPVVLGIACGCGLLTLVLAADVIRETRRLFK